jgi:biotin transport system substrate-specific component
MRIDPTSATSTGPRWAQLGAVAAAAAAIWVGALVSFVLPGTNVPQTGQTLAVLLAGALLGPVRGALAVLAYLAAGAAGAPVFAGGAAGVDVLAGPTGGFLVSFLPAAALAGWAARRARPDAAGLGMLTLWLLAAHGLILLCGWARLAVQMGAASALAAGVAPFLLGAAVKSVLAAAPVSMLLWQRHRRGPCSDS